VVEYDTAVGGRHPGVTGDAQRERQPGVPACRHPRLAGWAASEGKALLEAERPVGVPLLHRALLVPHLIAGSGRPDRGHRLQAGAVAVTPSRIPTSTVPDPTVTSAAPNRAVRRCGRLAATKPGPDRITR
jgi:hypothetical protein